MSTVRNNLLTREGYTPYCGNNVARHLPFGCDNPRTKFNGNQFFCPKCGWISNLPDDFIKLYKKTWKIQ